MKDAHTRRKARGEVVGFQKGHKKFRKPVSQEETERRVETFKKNYIPKSKPSCEECGKKLWKWKNKRCREHMDYSFRKGKPSANKGKHWKLNLNEEQKKRRTEVGKARIMSVSARQKIRTWHVNNPNKKFSATGIEIKMEEELKKRNIVFEKQVPLCNIAKVDFYLPEHRIVIECDGCYWHGCTEHYPQNNQQQKEKDVRKKNVLAFNGFNVYRFWEHEINESVKDCIDKIF